MPDPFREVSEDEVRRLLPLWDAGEFADLPGERGGTANPAVVVDTTHGRFFLKRRNPRYSAPEMLRHDHALMEHLAAKGFPAPLAVRSRDGLRWVEVERDVFELYPYMPGTQHDPSNLAQIEEAGRRLAAFHAAALGFDRPPGKDWPRYHDPAKTVEALEWALHELDPTASEREGIAGLLEVTRNLAADLPDDRYWSFPSGLVHGDWHPANVKYEGERICGVFDLDWATRQPRAVDLADGVIFFAGVRRSPLDAGDIRSLTQAFELHPVRTTAFLTGYSRGCAVGVDEFAALPRFMLARWLYCRADPMRRKIARTEAVPFLLHEVWAPIEAIRSLNNLASAFAEC